MTPHSHFGPRTTGAYAISGRLLRLYDSAHPAPALTSRLGVLLQVFQLFDFSPRVARIASIRSFASCVM